MSGSALTWCSNWAVIVRRWVLSTQPRAKLPLSLELKGQKDHLPVMIDLHRHPHQRDGMIRVSPEPVDGVATPAQVVISRDDEQLVLVLPLNGAPEIVERDAELGRGGEVAGDGCPVDPTDQSQHAFLRSAVSNPKCRSGSGGCHALSRPPYTQGWLQSCLMILPAFGRPVIQSDFRIRHSGAVATVGGRAHTGPGAKRAGE